MSVPAMACLQLYRAEVNHAPYLASPSSFRTDENVVQLNNAPPGTVVYTVVAGDIDVEQNHTYWLVGGNYNSTFRVRSSILGRRGGGRRGCSRWMSPHTTSA